MSTETWTPLLVIIPKDLAERLREVVGETMRSADDRDRLNIENFCAEKGWPSDALAMGAWLTEVIRQHVTDD